MPSNAYVSSSLKSSSGLDQLQIHWLWGQGSNLHFQIQSLMSYLLDDPKTKNPEKRLSLGVPVLPEGRRNPALLYSGGLNFHLRLAPIHGAYDKIVDVIVK